MAKAAEGVNEAVAKVLPAAIDPGWANPMDKNQRRVKPSPTRLWLRHQIRASGVLIEIQEGIRRRLRNKNKLAERDTAEKRGKNMNGSIADQGADKTTTAAAATAAAAITVAAVV